MRKDLPAFSLDRIDDKLATLEARSAHSPLAYGIQHEAAISALCEGYLRASARDRKMAVDALWVAAEDAGLDADAVARAVYEKH